MKEEKCFRQWKIFWTIIAIGLSGLVLSSFFKISMALGNWSVKQQGINKLLFETTGYTGIIGSMIIGCSFSLLLMVVSLWIIWGTINLILYGEKENG